AALDLHKKIVEAVVLDDTGRVLHRDHFSTTREALTDFARNLPSNTHISIEATTNTWAVVQGAAANCFALLDGQKDGSATIHDCPLRIAERLHVLSGGENQGVVSVEPKTSNEARRE
ncbi:MAG TPA: hypothetical protein VKG25_28510, partial [Bryobacteraceae bacterium]|nr:hypothetical protein [Bryobacteraceae bacterium]